MAAMKYCKVKKTKKVKKRNAKKNSTSIKQGNFNTRVIQEDRPHHEEQKTKETHFSLL